MREVLGSYRVAVETAAIVVILIGVRALLWAIGMTGMSTGGVLFLTCWMKVQPRSSSSWA